MFNSPITGLSFITNALIVVIGFTVNIIRRRPFNQAIISHKHILKLESTPFGSWVTSLVSVLMPFFIFVASGILSGYGLVNLYRDETKVSIVDVAVSGAHYGVKGYTRAKDKVELLSDASHNILDGNITKPVVIDKAITKLSTNLATFVNPSSIGGNTDLFVTPDTIAAASQKFAPATFLETTRLSSSFVPSITIEKAASSLFESTTGNLHILQNEGDVLGAFSQASAGQSWITNNFINK
jgi:hypothetical protein